jgi:hypothetical protein
MERRRHKFCPDGLVMDDMAGDEVSVSYDCWVPFGVLFDCSYSRRGNWEDFGYWVDKQLMIA